MDNMVLEEKKVKDICNFYVSDYHLEIMLLPYISKKIEEGEEIVIITEKNLAETLKEVINKTNINEDKRDKIINLGWNKQEKDIKINIIKDLPDIVKDTNEVPFVEAENFEYLQHFEKFHLKSI